MRWRNPLAIGWLVVAAIALLLSSASPVAACSGPARTFEDVLAQSRLIVEGRVTQALVNGLAYDIAVDEVFKGTVPGSTVRVGPQSDPGGRGCETALEVGGHLIVAVADPDAILNSLATAVWYIADDGSLSSPGNYYTMAADANDLRDKLRAALPDSALPQPTNAATPLGVLLALIALVWALVLRTRLIR